MQVNPILLFLFAFALLSCQAQTNSNVKTGEGEKSASEVNPVDSFYLANKGNDRESRSEGTVSNGKLINGKLVPFRGQNFRYFDTSSYFGRRAYLNDKVLETVLAVYDTLDLICPERKFVLMECSNKEGGQIPPHRTHQNGLSVDFMIPLLRGDEPFYGLDSMGASHYLLTFDETGRYAEDSTIRIDFDMLGHHILLLDEFAGRFGLKISKVILKMELKDELYTSKYGRQIKDRGIYITKNLTPLINELHDDHFHVDFEFH